MATAVLVGLTPLVAAVVTVEVADGLPVAAGFPEGVLGDVLLMNPDGVLVAGFSNHDTTEESVATVGVDEAVVAAFPKSDPKAVAGNSVAELVVVAPDFVATTEVVLATVPSEVVDLLKRPAKPEGATAPSVDMEVLPNRVVATVVEGSEEAEGEEEDCVATDGSCGGLSADPHHIRKPAKTLHEPSA